MVALSGAPVAFLGSESWCAWAARVSREHTDPQMLTERESDPDLAARTAIQRGAALVVHHSRSPKNGGTALYGHRYCN